MPAATTDHFTDTYNGTRPVPTTLAAIMTSGSSPGTITLNSATGWPTNTKVHFCIYTTDANNKKVTGSQTDWSGIVSGTTISSLTLTAGTNLGYSIGAIVECAPTAGWGHDLISGLITQHNQDGTHAAVTAASLSVSGASTLTGALTIQSWDGYIASPDTWTYVSATSFKIAGVDRTAQFPVGTKIKLTQTTAKYFYVASASFSTDTTVTITGGSDYTLANAAITGPFYSYTASPQGFPHWFTFAPALTGFSVNPVGNYRFNVIGRQCTIDFTNSATGTSSSVNFTAVAPITSANLANTYWGTAVWFAADNSVALTTPGRAWIVGNTTTINIGRTSAADGNWTATGGKQATFTLIYEI